MDKETAVTLTGTVEDVVFYNEDNGYIVIDLDCDGELVTVVGNLGDVREGESLTLLGEYINSPKYGRQFRAEVCERSLPNTESAVRKFLGSGVIAGIGPAMAKRIVTAFGSKTLEMIENDPGQLSSIKGISPESAKKIGEDFRRIAGLRKAVTYFARYGLTPAVVALAWKKFELNTVQAVEDNPWCLCGTGIELPFREADRVARDMDFPMDSEERVLAGILWCLRENANNGHTCITENDLSDRVTFELNVSEKQFWNGLLMAEERGEITRCDKYDDKFVFLTEYYRAECSIAEKLAEMIKRSDGGDVDFSQEIAGIELEQGIRYEELQREAINGCMNNHVFILTGGPGTGKTTTLNAVISLCRKRGLKMKLAAPTGRAAKRMADLTGAPAQTIHRLLEVDFGSKSHAFKRREDNPLTCDVLIIDEMSMVDTLLMESLLHAVRPRTRLIMVGDSNQLPSVGAGNILRDLISSGRVPAVELKKIFRQASESDIVVNAHKINKGEQVEINNKSRDFFFLKRYDADIIIRVVIALIQEKLPKYVEAKPFEIQVLTPMRKGLLGVERLNQILQRYLNPPDASKKEREVGQGLFREGDKVMQVRNNYQLEWEIRGRYGIPIEKGVGVFNGDTGIIKTINEFAETAEVEFEDGRWAEYSFKQLDELELAYAVTIHKSQGSEYPAVIIPLLSGPRMLMNRNLLYTAVTRARKCVTVVGSEETFREMIRNEKQQRRYSSLDLRIQETE